MADKSPIVSTNTAPTSSPPVINPIPTEVSHVSPQKPKLPLLSVVLILLMVAGLVGSGVMMVKRRTSDITTSSPASITETLTPTPTPMPTGNLSGQVLAGYYSRPAANVNITISGPMNQTGMTNDAGNFTFNDLPVGEYTLTLTHAEYTFSDLSLTIKEGQNNLDKPITGSLTHPQPLTVSGTIYSDKNSNKIKDGVDTPLDASVSVYYKGALFKTLMADSAGKVSVTLSSLGEYRLVPGHFTGYVPPAESTVVVDGYGGTKSLNIPYVPTVSQAGFKIYVFNDKNENGSRDDGEENVSYQAVQITNLTGNSTMAIGNTWQVAVPPGGQTESPVDYANYSLKLNPESSAWADAFKITKSQETITVSATSSIVVVYLGAHKLY